MASYAEIRDAIHHTISQAAQVQAWLKTINTDIDHMHARMLHTGEGTASDDMLQAIARLAMAKKEPERLVALLEEAKTDLYHYLESH